MKKVKSLFIEFSVAFLQLNKSTPHNEVTKSRAKKRRGDGKNINYYTEKGKIDCQVIPEATNRQNTNRPTPLFLSFRPEATLRLFLSLFFYRVKKKCSLHCPCDSFVILYRDARRTRRCGCFCFFVINIFFFFVTDFFFFYLTDENETKLSTD